MKTFICFCLLLVGVTALPETLESALIDGINRHDERLITGPIVQAIEDFSQSIKDAGLDPYVIERESFKSDFPVPNLYSIEAIIEDLLVKGLSNIVVHNINYNIFFNRLTFDIRFPGIFISIGKASKDITILGSNSKSSLSGSIAIHTIRFRGNIRISLGIISGITIRSIEINFDVGDISSEVKVVLNGKDVSRLCNVFIGKVIPEKLKEVSKDIDELLTIIVKQLIEANI